jgi:hypothetical protein
LKTASTKIISGLDAKSRRGTLAALKTYRCDAKYAERAKWNWKLPMAELARIHGLKKQRVFQIRNELLKFKLIKNVRRTQTVGDVEGSVVGG